MNQIISNFNDNSENIESLYSINLNYNNKSNLKSKKTLYLFLFIFFVIISMCLLIYYMNFKHKVSTLDKISKNIAKSYSITKIYNNDNNSDGSNYNMALLSNEILFYEGANSYIIGTISIDKINISYPILSDISKENLKISPCRFYGPMPNKIGNLCIAGHNYKNNTFFSNLSKLENNDIIKIQDNTREDSKI